MMIAHIVAAAENGVIGKDGDLPWSIPEDMKWFRDRTKGRALIMGRKTFEAVEHPLPKRLNVVVTRQKDYKPAKMAVDPSAPVIITDTIEKAIAICKEHVDKWMNEIFIIGGGEIYHQSVKFVDTIYLTRIHRPVEGDATYPDPDPSVFKLTESIKRTAPEPFTFETWIRK
jgi:dihydrofolate reductase